MVGFNFLEDFEEELLPDFTVIETPPKLIILVSSRWKGTHVLMISLWFKLLESNFPVELVCKID